MAKKASEGYFGLGRIVSLILAIIPPTAWVCGVITAFQRGNILGGVVRIFFGLLLWPVDLVTMIIHKKVWVLC